MTHRKFKSIVWMILFAVALTSIPTMAVPSEFEEEELEAKEYAEMSLDCGIKHAGREAIFDRFPAFWRFR